MRIKTLTTLAAGALLLGAPAALADTFAMSPGGLNRISFENDAPFETITGISNSVSGSLQVDLRDLSRAKGEVSIPVTSIQTGIAKRDEHLHSEMWLDAKRHPNLKLVVDRIEGGEALSDGKSTTVKVHGKLTIKGKTNTIIAPAKISFHKATEKTKKAWITSDALRVRALVKINIRDYGVIPPDNLAGIKVADEVEIKASLTALKK